MFYYAVLTLTILKKIDYNYGKSYEELISKIAEVLNE